MMKTLRKLAGVLGLSIRPAAPTGAPAPPPSAQAVIVSFHYGSRDLSRLHALEDRLESVIKASGVGQYDCHEIAVDGSDGVLYMYGPDADLLFEKVAPLLTSTDFMAGAQATRRYGPPGDGVLKVSETIGTSQPRLRDS